MNCFSERLPHARQHHPPSQATGALRRGGDGAQVEREQHDAQQQHHRPHLVRHGAQKQLADACGRHRLRARARGGG
jgi:hypothetical protein